MQSTRQLAFGVLGFFLPFRRLPQMANPVSTLQDFTTQAPRRKPEQFEFVKFRMEKGVARITLSRPEHNLLNEGMLREIADGMVFAGEHDEVKLIVLDSACKVFSGGIDIGEYTNIDTAGKHFAGRIEDDELDLVVLPGKDHTVGNFAKHAFIQKIVLGPAEGNARNALFHAKF